MAQVRQAGVHRAAAWGLLVMVLVWMGGCAAWPPAGRAPAAAPQPGGPTAVGERAFAWSLRCGDEAVHVGYQGDVLVMQAQGRAYRMRPLPAASGAKYEAEDDPRTTFWSRGHVAQVVLGGREGPECRVVERGAQAWRATGNEPFWHLDVHGPRLSFATADGSFRAQGRWTGPQGEGDVATYTAPTNLGPLQAVATRRLCTDSMSGMPYPQTVTVEVQGRRFQGCGGDPAELLRGGEWVVEDIAGGGIVDGSRVTVQFGPGERVTGRASCNRYTGRYALNGEGLQLKGLASTRMACAEALNRQEARFLQLLGQVVRHEFTADGALVLVAADGQRLRARRG